MHRLTKVFLALTLSCGVPLSVFTQTRNDPAAPQDDTRLVVNTAEVLLDTVVRDKRGRVVRDLTASDFEVYEDGVRQDLKSSRFVTRETAAGASASDGAKSESSSAQPTISPAQSAPSPSGVSALALVFDRLSPDGRARTRQVALDYVEKQMKQGSTVGVFLTGLSLEVMQPYTSDLRLIKQGIERAGSQSPALYTSNNEEARKVRDSLTKELQESGKIALRGPEAEMAMMYLKSLESWETLQRNQQGQATTNGLLAVADSLGQVDGRKAMIFFSEGVAIPPDVLAQFRSVISHANRAGVSIYAVDAAGLRAESATSETRKEIESRSGLRMATLGMEDDIKLGPMTKGLERNEDLLRLNPHSGLGQLADETGGLLIRDTNNLADGLRRIDEDMGAYHLLSYTPKNANYDGRFRRVEVRPKRAGLSVQSRKGYYALAGSFAAPVLAYEAPALAIAAGGRRPTDLVVRAAAFSFPEANRPGLVPVVVEVPTRFVAFAGDEAKQRYSADFSVVVLIKDERGQVVGKLSERYTLGGALAQLTAARQGDVLFYREAELDPGKYTVETIVHDALGNKAGVHHSALDVPAADDAGIRLSSVVVVKRAEQLTAAERKTTSPLHYGDTLLYPNTGEPLSRGANKQLAFFFTAYVTQSAAAQPKLAIEVQHNDRTIVTASDTLPAPDATGRIQFASALPLDKFPPGTYELKITVGDAAGAFRSRSTTFTVEP